MHPVIYHIAQMWINEKQMNWLTKINHQLIKILRQLSFCNFSFWNVKICCFSLIHFFWTGLAKSNFWMSLWPFPDILSTMTAWFTKIKAYDLKLYKSYCCILFSWLFFIFIWKFESSFRFNLIWAWSIDSTIKNIMHACFYCDSF